MQVKSIAECSEDSALLLTFIRLPFVIKIFVLSIFEWPFYTGLTVVVSQSCGIKNNLFLYCVYMLTFEIDTLHMICTNKLLLLFYAICCSYRIFLSF